MTGSWADWSASSTAARCARSGRRTRQRWSRWSSGPQPTGWCCGRWGRATPSAGSASPTACRSTCPGWTGASWAWTLPPGSPGCRRGSRCTTCRLPLHARGRALQNLGDIDRQTLAGRCPPLRTAPARPSATSRRRWSAADWSPRTARCASSPIRTTPTASTIPLASTIPTAPTCCGLRASRWGSWECWSEVSVQTVPAFRLRKREQPRRLADVLTGLDELVAGHDHVEFYAVPYSRRALVPDVAAHRRSRLRPAAGLAHLADRRPARQPGPRPCCSAPAGGCRAAQPGPGAADWSPALSGSTPARPQPPGVRHRAPGPVHRVGVGAAAGRRAGGRSRP